MKLNLYAVYDKVKQECGPLFGSKNDATALRQFQNEHQKMSLENELDLSDYELQFIATFDNETMNLTDNEPHEVTPNIHMVDQLNEEAL